MIMEIISLAVIFILITIIGTIGNAIVLFVLCVNKQLHDRTNILIGNLALADLLFLIYCAPVTAYSYVFSWGLSESLCYIAVTLQYVTCYVSVWTLVFLAYDRYLSITSSTVTTRIRQGNTVIYVCIVIWVAMFAINFPHMRNVGVLRFEFDNTTRAACVDSLAIATETSSVAGARLFYWSFNFLAFLLPLALTIVFYLLLVKELWKEKMVKSKSSKRMKRHATKMVFIVIITFAICWLPQNIRFFLRGLNYPELSFWEKNAELLLLIQSTAQILAYLNSLLNPILYGLLSERFRNGVARAWMKFCLCKNASTADIKQRTIVSTQHKASTSDAQWISTGRNGLLEHTLTSTNGLIKPPMEHSNISKKSNDYSELLTISSLTTSRHTEQTTICAGDEDSEEEGDVVLL